MALKISTFMIGIVLIAAFVVTFGSFLADINANYTVDYDNSSLDAFNKLENIKNISEDIEARHSEDATNKDLFDVLGNIIADGIDIVRLGSNSYGALIQLKDASFDKLNIPNIWSVVAFVIIIIIIFVAILLRIKVGSDV